MNVIQSSSVTDSKFRDLLQELSVTELLEILNKNMENSSILSTENNVYRHILKEEQQTYSEIEEMDKVTEDVTDILPLSTKCYFASKQLKQLDEELKNLNFTYSILRELKFEIDALNLKLKNLQRAKNQFKKVELDRHPVFKKVMLQKVASYMNESIKSKQAMSNRYKIQIESLIADYYKIMNQIKDHKKRLVSLDFIKSQEIKNEHLKVNETLATQKESIILFKNRHRSLVQKVHETKNALKEEEIQLCNSQKSLSHKEELKNVILTERFSNDQEMEKLNNAMRKIRLDPRRHDLPQVIEYAAVKRQNENLKQSIKLWKKKICVAEQAKLMHLNALRTEKEK